MVSSLVTRLISYKGADHHLRVKPVGAVLVVGYGVKTYLEAVQTRRMAQIEAMERENAAFKERNETLMNMYGDRSSLNELEKAIEFYEKR